MQYPIDIKPNGEFFLVTFPDFPGAIAQGQSSEETLSAAADALNTVLEFYFDEKFPIPMPSPVESGQSFVELNSGDAERIFLLNRMSCQEIGLCHRTEGLLNTEQPDNYGQWMQEHRGTISPDLDLDF